MVSGKDGNIMEKQCASDGSSLVLVAKGGKGSRQAAKSATTASLLFEINADARSATKRNASGAAGGTIGSRTTRATTTAAGNGKTRE